MSYGKLKPYGVAINASGKFMGGRGLSLEALNKDEADGVPPLRIDIIRAILSDLKRT